MIKSRLRLSNTLYARKTEIREIDAITEREFLNNNHLQGYVSSSVCHGLYYENELVSVMSFGKARFKKSGIELLRFCNKLNTSVIGGSSKLFKYSIIRYKWEHITSYSHIDKFNGNMYTVLGFKYSHSSNPAYYYTKNYYTFENRLKYQKHKLSELLENFDCNITEWDNMKNNGYDRLWDCGNDVWIWDIENKYIMGTV